MLLPPAAQGVALSVTLDDLPSYLAYYRHEITPGHHLIVARRGITYGALTAAYIRGLPPWARRRLYAALGQPDPVDTPELEARMRWWDPEWPVSEVSVELLENAGCHAGLITPWPHKWTTHTRERA